MPEDKHNPKYVDLMPPCFYCKHLIDIGLQDSNERWTCKAYPEGIPYSIWARHEKHDVEMPGQKPGYYYESKKYDLPDGKGQVISFEGKWSK